jgi:2-polyprenyl-6-methoxyphenol hydroxylase-like FAD-dependent oxidoreductase
MDVQLHLKDGTSVEADCVIGAEGVYSVHSVTRRFLLGTTKGPQYHFQHKGSVSTYYIALR